MKQGRQPCAWTAQSKTLGVERWAIVASSWGTMERDSQGGFLGGGLLVSWGMTWGLFSYTGILELFQNIFPPLRPSVEESRTK